MPGGVKDDIQGIALSVLLILGMQQREGVGLRLRIAAFSAGFVMEKFKLPSKEKTVAFRIQGTGHGKHLLFGEFG